jgi:hypothetical protein
VNGASACAYDMNTSAAIAYSPPQLFQVGVKVDQVPQMQVCQDCPAASTLFELRPGHPVYDTRNALSQRPCGPDFDPNPGPVDRRWRKQRHQFVRAGNFTTDLRLEVIPGCHVVDIDKGLSAAIGHTPAICRAIHASFDPCDMNTFIDWHTCCSEESGSPVEIPESRRVLAWHLRRIPVANRYNTTGMVYERLIAEVPERIGGGTM